MRGRGIPGETLAAFVSMVRAHVLLDHVGETHDALPVDLLKDREHVDHLLCCLSGITVEQVLGLWAELPAGQDFQAERVLSYGFASHLLELIRQAHHCSSPSQAQMPDSN